MAVATMALSSSFAAAAAGSAPWRGVVAAGRAAVGFPPRRPGGGADEGGGGDVVVTDSDSEPRGGGAQGEAGGEHGAVGRAGDGGVRVGARRGGVARRRAPGAGRQRGGLAWFAATAAVLSAASLVPLLRGESAEARSGGVMSADAELWNGRFAMLGLVALAFTEFLTGSPLVNV
uniref:Uncharacterized protein n=1 Tax=Oryza barthii TaxID=65489 RepID=A0A0D3GMX4_9ORYZ